MNVWIVEYVDGKCDRFDTAPEGIQILNPGVAPILVVHRVLGQAPVFINGARVQKWYCEKQQVAPFTPPAGGIVRG